jgi:hypothetical protein
MREGERGRDFGCSEALDGVTDLVKDIQFRNGLE